MSDPVTTPPYPTTRTTRNAKALNWPKFQDKDSKRFTPAYKEYTEDMEVCYNLVRIGSYLTGKDLNLKTGNTRDGVLRAATDGKNIFLPKMHPNRRVAVKHELSHIFFKSNLALRLAFIRGLIKELEEERNKEFPPHVKKQIIDDLAFFINILDDMRVNSLWGLVYPGDGRDMDDWYVKTVGADMMEKAQTTFKNGDIDHLFTYAILLCLDQPAKSTKWGEFEDDIIEARDSVLWASFPACLVSCKKLVHKIARKLAKELEEAELHNQPNPLDQLPPVDDDTKQELGKVDDSDQDMTQPSANDDISKDIEQAKLDKMLEKALNQMWGGTRPDPDKFRSDDGAFDVDYQVKDGDVAKADNQAAAMLRVDVEDDEEFELFLGGVQDAGADDVADIKDRLAALGGTSRLNDEGDWLKNAVKADVDIVHVPRNNLRSAQLSTEDNKNAERWRKQFLRVMGSLKNRMVYAGGRVSVPDLIRTKTGGVPLPCFIRETTGRGFEVMVSVDMSGSMHGHFSQVERLAVMLRKSMDFPFVKMGFQGWSSREEGQITLYRYPRCAGNEGLISPQSQVDGVTPLSHAVQLAGRSMQNSRNERHVFLLTDGFPVYKLKGGAKYMATDALMEWTRDAVMDLRKQRIRVWCWMIGVGTPNPEKMDYMFGPKNWKKISTDDIYTDSFDFLTKQFLTYLRSR